MASCRDQRPTNVAYYARNREREIARVRVRQDATLAMLRRLREVPCADCGVRFAPHQMDFDHRNPADKSLAMTSGAAMLASRPRLLLEVAKCDVVCANCHRVRTRTAHRRRLAERVQAGSSPGIAQRRARWRAHARILDSLRDVPCFDCGRRFPACSMDFDHRDPNDKLAAVTRMVGRAGFARIVAEAAKCDIVCANCHRARTFKRRLLPAPERE
jgi:hypothetical protein